MRMCYLGIVLNLGTAQLNKLTRGKSSGARRTPVVRVRTEGSGDEDRRTNFYKLTRRGRREIEDRHEWEAQYGEEIIRLEAALDSQPPLVGSWLWNISIEPIPLPATTR